MTSNFDNFKKSITAKFRLDLDLCSFSIIDRKMKIGSSDSEQVIFSHRLIDEQNFDIRSPDFRTQNLKVHFIQNLYKNFG